MDRRTDLRERIADRDGMEPASRAEVVRYWLENELDPNEPDLDPAAVDDEERLVAELVDRKPIAARAFRPQRLEWFGLDLSAAELADLRVVEGPEDDEWRRVVNDGMLVTAAYRLFEDDPERVDRETAHDLAEVADIADDIGDDGPPEDLILVQDRPGELPWVADGNHTAAAQLLAALRGEAYPGQRAYLGVRPVRTEP
ncbi:hypothetical protein G9464_05990 [Halostella sp. JP-L12]|uniref:hypothetical protein n=1 Tax=Halostella TaxID=1843185 RepID=UPI000EF76888|nr:MULTISPECIES: hypothetical protein [Halostella]NHN47149.1 hypothetical protein [Halostella sp. JP-L12]